MFQKAKQTLDAVSKRFRIQAQSGTARVRMGEILLVALLAALPPFASASEAASRGSEEQQRCGVAASAGSPSSAAQRELPHTEVQVAAPLRNGPNLACEITYIVPAGGTLDVIACGDDWCHVRYGSETGFLPAVILDPMQERTPGIE